MKNKIIKILAYLFVLIVIVMNLRTVEAALLGDTTKIEEQVSLGLNWEGIFDESASVGDVMATVITAFLGLLGIIFIVLIVYAGYNYLTAAGEEEKVEKAMSTIKRAIIGLIIITAAYSITYFVFKNLPGMGSGTSGGSNSDGGVPLVR